MADEILRQIEDAPNPHFVWVKGLRGPQGHKWAELNYGTNGRLLKDGSILATHPLTQEEWRVSIDMLEKMFPPPVNYS